MKKQFLILCMISGLSYALQKEKTDPSFSSCTGWKHFIMKASLSSCQPDKELLRHIMANYNRDNCQTVTGKSLDDIVKGSK